MTDPQTQTGGQYFNAACDLLDSGQRDSAAAMFDCAATAYRTEIQAPGDEAQRTLAMALYNAAFLRELRVPDTTIEPKLREAVEIDPNYAAAIMALGNLCLRNQREEEGLSWLARAQELDPDNGQPFFYRARHFAENGKFQLAVVDARHAFIAYSRRGQVPFAADATMMSGECNEKLGNWHEALADYERAYDAGHTLSVAKCHGVENRIAVEDPSSEIASRVFRSIADAIQKGECPWHLIDALEARTKNAEHAHPLVAKLKEGVKLSADETAWLVEVVLAN